MVYIQRDFNKHRCQNRDLSPKIIDFGTLFSFNDLNS